VTVKDPDYYAVFGNPVAHSKSPMIHTLFAEQTGEELVYKALKVEEGEFSSEVNDFFARDNHFGLNITVPFKQQAYDLAEHLSDRAGLAEAVNTLYQEEGRIHGDNTDGVGLIRDIRQNLNWELEGKAVLVLGAGGAVRGILEPLLAESPLEVAIANRTASKAEELVEVFESYAGEANLYALSYPELEQSVCFDLVINGTSASLSGELPPLPGGIVADSSHCYDMMYGKDDTVFLQWAKHQGVQNCADGLGMLVEQAAESFYIWRGLRPRTQTVISAVREQL